MQEERLRICSECGIYNSVTQICRGDLAIDPLTNNVCLLDVNKKPKKPGYIKGCGCYCPVKTKREGNHCPANKW